MKHSIKRIFKNLMALLMLITFVMAIGGLSMMSENISYDKINILKNQKEIISKLMILDKSDLAFAQIQLHGKSSEVLNEVDNLRNIYKYDFIGKYVINNSNEYLSDLDELAKLTITFNEKASDYYTKDMKNINATFQELQIAFDTINNYINATIIKIVSYEEIKFHIFEKIYMILFIIIFLTTIWYQRRFITIYNDILFLFAVNSGKTDNYEPFSREVDAIAMRMKKKPVLSEDKSLIDFETDIYNSKGLHCSYAEKKNLKSDNIASITVLEIDNFSKSHQIFTEEIAQTILKNISFTISLHEQPTDIIARNEYNQFTIILCRTTKEKSLKEIEAIRQSISEIKFMNKAGEKTQITVSGGFVVKTETASLEETMNIAKKVLQQAIDNGGNKISQESNLIRR